MDNIYKEKALERLEIANWQVKTENMPTLGSTLYFALFNFMQSVLGEPPEGKWKHGGILNLFSKKCYKENLLDKQTLKKLSSAYEDLYIYRLKSDYKRDTLTEKEKIELLALKDLLNEVIGKWQK